MARGKLLFGGTLAASLLISTPFIGGWEGKRNDPYKDIAGIQTVCYGETRVKMRRYSDEECLKMLEKAVKGFAEPVLKATPGLTEHPKALAAATSLAYNIGMTNYNNSSARKRFNEGNLVGGCSAIKLWDKARINGKLQTVKGLQNRRDAEYKLCMEDSSTSLRLSSVVDNTEYWVVYN